MNWIRLIDDIYNARLQSPRMRNVCHAFLRLLWKCVLACVTLFVFIWVVNALLNAYILINDSSLPDKSLENNDVSPPSPTDDRIYMANDLRRTGFTYVDFNPENSIINATFYNGIDFQNITKFHYKGVCSSREELLYFTPSTLQIPFRETGFFEGRLPDKYIDGERFSLHLFYEVVRINPDTGPYVQSVDLIDFREFAVNVSK